MNKKEKQLLQKLIPLIRNHLKGRCWFPVIVVSETEKESFSVREIGEEFEFEDIEKDKLEEVAASCAKQENDMVLRLHMMLRSHMKTLFLLQDWQIAIEGNKAKLYERIAVPPELLLAKGR